MIDELTVKLFNNVILVSWSGVPSLFDPVQTTHHVHVVHLKDDLGVVRFIKRALVVDALVDTKEIAEVLQRIYLSIDDVGHP
jgi:hypothetical protein